MKIRKFYRNCSAFENQYAIIALAQPASECQAVGVHSEPLSISEMYTLVAGVRNFFADHGSEDSPEYSKSWLHYSKALYLALSI